MPSPRAEQYANDVERLRAGLACSSAHRDVVDLSFSGMGNPSLTNATARLHPIRANSRSSLSLLPLSMTILRLCVGFKAFISNDGAVGRVVGNAD